MGKLGCGCLLIFIGVFCLIAVVGLFATNPLILTTLGSLVGGIVMVVYSYQMTGQHATIGLWAGIALIAVAIIMTLVKLAKSKE